MFFSNNNFEQERIEIIMWELAKTIKDCKMEQESIVEYKNRIFSSDNPILHCHKLQDANMQEVVFALQFCFHSTIRSMVLCTCLHNQNKSIIYCFDITGVYTLTTNAYEKYTDSATMVDNFTDMATENPSHLYTICVISTNTEMARNMFLRGHKIQEQHGTKRKADMNRKEPAAKRPKK